MSEETKIQWCDSTASPWTICSKVSPGCEHCYAADLAKRYGWGDWGPGKPRHKFKGFAANCRKWNKRLTCDCGIVEIDPLDTRTTACPKCQSAFRRKRIFPSLCDWLDDEVPIEWLAEFLQVIHECQNLDFLMLTKRPELFFDRVKSAYKHAQIGGFPGVGPMTFDWVGIPPGTPPQNVWIGASVEDQERTDERIPELLKIPARVRFLSCEPLLGPINLHCAHGFCACPTEKISLVIVGGESGPKARPIEVAWIQSIADQCAAANVPLFVKQDSGSKPGRQGRIPSALWSRKEFPNA